MKPTKPSTKPSTKRDSANPLELLQKRLGHTFANPKLLDQALTHRSFSSTNNERLEFLGDAVLGAVTAEMLYTALPNVAEGQLHQIRANLVREASLFELAKKLQVGSCLKLGAGELQSGGDKRPSILADAVEALVGAVFLDAGFDVAKQRVQDWLQDVQVSLTVSQATKDAKTELQEWLQAKRAQLPSYVVIGTSGALHEQTFDVQCTVSLPSHFDAPVQERGSGQTRRAAEQAAAAAVLAKIKVLDNVKPEKKAPTIKKTSDKKIRTESVASKKAALKKSTGKKTVAKKVKQA